jgi:ADP-ribose pyrophosphatase YjhB (NUDIX family)
VTNRHLVDVHILLIRDGEVLLSRRRSADEFDGLWHLPAGKLEFGESATVAAAREAGEEIGVVIDPADLTSSGREARLGLFFHARRWTGAPENREPDKSYGLQWFSLDALPEESLIRYSATGIRGLTMGTPYSELGWAK